MNLFPAACSALQGLLRKLGANFEDMMPMSGVRIKVCGSSSRSQVQQGSWTCFQPTAGWEDAIAHANICYLPAGCMHSFISSLWPGAGLPQQLAWRSVIWVLSTTCTTAFLSS